MQKQNDKPVITIDKDLNKLVYTPESIAAWKAENDADGKTIVEKARKILGEEKR